MWTGLQGDPGPAPDLRRRGGAAARHPWGGGAEPRAIRCQCRHRVAGEPARHKVEALERGVVPCIHNGTPDYALSMIALCPIYCTLPYIRCSKSAKLR